MATITSANLKQVITVRSASGIVVGPFTLEGFWTDDAFLAETVDTAVAQKGVDNKLSAGWIPRIPKQVFKFSPDSKSVPLMEAWVGAQDVLQDVLFAESSLSLPGLGKAYVGVKGTLTRYTPVPPAGKTMQPQEFEISWESLTPVPISV